MANREAERWWVSGGVTRRRCLGLGASVAFLGASPAWAMSDELLVFVHLSNATRNLEPSELEQIFASQRLHWGSGRRILPFNLPPRSVDRERFDRAVLRLAPDDVARFWIDRRIRGGAPPPRQVPTPELAVRVVASIREAIAYAPASFVGKDVRAVARIVDGKVRS